MKKFIVTVFLLLLMTISYCQTVGIIPSMILAQPGEQINIPVVISESGSLNTSVAAIELYIDFNNNSLNYTGVTNFNQLLPEAEWFVSTPSPDINRFSCNWAQSNLENIEIPSGTTIFEIEFTYLGGESALTFDPLASILVYMDGINPIQLNVDFSNGYVKNAPSAEVTIWNGVGNWNSGLWSNGVPGDGSTAIIETGEVIIENAIGNTRKLIVYQGASVKVMPDNFLTIVDTLENHGLITSISDISGNGSLIVNHILITTDGNIKVEQWVSGQQDHLIGSPVMNETSNVFGSYNAYSYNESTSAFDLLQSGSELTVGKGYRVVPDQNETFVFENNNLNTNDVTLQLAYSENPTPEFRGLNLISNPYSSAMNWDSGDWMLTNVGKSIYLWDSTRYLVWNGLFGDLPDGTIPSMQGFFVKANAPDAQIKIPANSRIHSNTPFFKDTRNLTNLLKIETGKYIDGNPGPVLDRAFFHINFAATPVFDPEFDAYKYQNLEGTTMLYLQDQVNNQKFSINVIPELQSILIGFKPGSNDTYYLRLINAESFDPALPITLEDLNSELPFPNNQVDMRSAVNDFTYFFSGNTNDEEIRFILHFSPVGIQDIPNREFSFEVINGNTLKLINNSNIHSPGMIEIFDLNGRNSLRKNILLQEQYELNIKGNTGLYIVRYIHKNSIISKKIFIVND